MAKEIIWHYHHMQSQILTYCCAAIFVYLFLYQILTIKNDLKRQ